MELLNKKVQVRHDEILGEFEISLSNDKDGTIWVKNAKTIREVMEIVGQITKTKITYID